MGAISTVVVQTRNLSGSAHGMCSHFGRESFFCVCACDLTKRCFRFLCRVAALQVGARVARLASLRVIAEATAATMDGRIVVSKADGWHCCLDHRQSGIDLRSLSMDRMVSVRPGEIFRQVLRSTLAPLRTQSTSSRSILDRMRQTIRLWFSRFTSTQSSFRAVRLIAHRKSLNSSCSFTFQRQHDLRRLRSPTRQSQRRTQRKFLRQRRSHLSALCRTSMIRRTSILL